MHPNYAHHWLVPVCHAPMPVSVSGDFLPPSIPSFLPYSCPKMEGNILYLIASFSCNFCCPFIQISHFSRSSFPGSVRLSTSLYSLSLIQTLDQLHSFVSSTLVIVSLSWLPDLTPLRLPLSLVFQLLLLRLGFQSPLPLMSSTSVCDLFSFSALQRSGSLL